MTWTHRATAQTNTNPSVWEVTKAWYPKKGKETEVAQSCPTLYDPMDRSPPGSSVHGIFQARELEWVAISFSRGDDPKERWRNATPISPAS